MLVSVMKNREDKTFAPRLLDESRFKLSKKVVHDDQKSPFLFSTVHSGVGHVMQKINLGIALLDQDHRQNIT